MIVRLTHAGGRVVMDRVGGLHAERMMEHREPYGRRQHDYELPAIAWRQILDKLIGSAYGPLGGKKQDEPRSLYTALQRIQTEVARREHHPALDGNALQGMNIETIPVWDCDGAWSVYPQPDTPMQLKLPVYLEIHGHSVTEWVLGTSPNPMYCEIEDSHREFQT